MPTVAICDSGEDLRRLLAQAPATVVHVRALALSSMFPKTLRDALGVMPYEVAAAVAPPEVLKEVDIAVARLGETMVFAAGRFVGRIGKDDVDPAGRVLGFLRASLSPWVGRRSSPDFEAWDDVTPAVPPLWQTARRAQELYGQVAEATEAEPIAEPVIETAGEIPRQWSPRPAATSSESDPFAVIGVPETANFDEVHAAWRARLAEYHPDRFARAGEKIRQVALAESQRLNAAFRAIARRYGQKRLS